MKRIEKFYSIIFLLLFFAFWEFCSDKGLINTFHVSSPSMIIVDLKEMISTGYIWEHIATTFGVSFLGLIIGTIFGVIFAFIFGQFPILSKIFDPILVGLNGLPKLALGPLFIVWFGIGFKSKVFISAISVLFIVFFNAYAGFKSVDPELYNTLKIMGASKIQLITNVTLPSCVPWIAASLRNGASVAVVGAIVGEYLGSTNGLGWLIQNAGGVYNITRVMSAIFILFVVMSLIDLVLKRIETKLLVWRK